MQKNSLKNNLIKIFRKELKIKKKFNMNSKLNDYKNWDSLANFNLLLNIENKCNIKFTTKEFSNLKSFKDIYIAVKNKN